MSNLPSRSRGACRDTRSMPACSLPGPWPAAAAHPLHTVCTPSQQLRLQGHRQHSPNGQWCSFHPSRSVIMGPCLTPPTQLPETPWILIPQDTPDTSASSFGWSNQLGEACLLTPRRMPPLIWSPPSGPPAQAPAGRPRLQHGKARLCQPWWPQKCSMGLIKNLTALEMRQSIFQPIASTPMLVPHGH